MKTCALCNLEKPLKDFYADAGSKGKTRSDCKSCKNKSTYKWREANREQYNRSIREYQEAHPRQRDACDLKRKYGKSIEWYDTTIKNQGHKCAICNKTNPSYKRRFAVDHDHITGTVRGILCYNCNRLLHAFDNVDLYNKILLYLNKYKKEI